MLFVQMHAQHQQNFSTSCPSQHFSSCFDLQVTGRVQSLNFHAATAKICHLRFAECWVDLSLVENSNQVFPGQNFRQPWCSKSCNQERYRRKEQFTFGIDCRIHPEYQVVWACLWMTQHYTETCNAHTGGGTNAQTGIVGSSAVQRNVSSDKGKISSALSHKTAPKSSIPAATDCVRKGPAAATRSGAATLRQSAIGKSALTNSC